VAVRLAPKVMDLVLDLLVLLRALNPTIMDREVKPTAQAQVVDLKHMDLALNPTTQVLRILDLAVLKALNLLALKPMDLNLLALKRMDLNLLALKRMDLNLLALNPTTQALRILDLAVLKVLNLLALKPTDLNLLALKRMDLNLVQAQAQALNRMDLKLKMDANPNPKVDLEVKLPPIIPMVTTKLS